MIGRSGSQADVEMRNRDNASRNTSMTPKSYSSTEISKISSSNLPPGVSSPIMSSPGLMEKEKENRNSRLKVDVSNNSPNVLSANSSPKVNEHKPKLMSEYHQTHQFEVNKFRDKNFQENSRKMYGGPSGSLYPLPDRYSNIDRKYERKSLPAKYLETEKNDYENINDSDREHVLSKFSDDDSDVDTASEIPSVKSSITIDVRPPCSPPAAPPMRDLNSMNFSKISQSHEKFSSWPVTVSNNNNDSSQPGSSRAQSWTDQTSTTTDFSKKQPYAYVPNLRPLAEKNSQNTDRKEEGDVKMTTTSTSALNSPKQSMSTTASPHMQNYRHICDNVDRFDEFYKKAKPGYPPPMFDSDGHNFGDKEYNIPSPPEKDTSSLETGNLSKSVLQQQLNRNRDLHVDIKNRKNLVDSSTSPLQTPNDSKYIAGNYPYVRYQGSLGETLQESSVPKTRDNSLHSPQANKSSLQFSDSPGLKTNQSGDSNRGYIVKQTPYYNTGTQTDKDNSESITYITKPTLKSTHISKNAEVQVDNYLFNKSDELNRRLLEEKSLQARLSVQSFDGADSGFSERYSNYADPSRRYFSSDSLRSADFSGHSRESSRDHMSLHSRDNSRDQGHQSSLRDEKNNFIPPYHEFTPSNAPMLRKLSEEFYGRLPSYSEKNLSSYSYENNIAPSPEPVKPPGMREAESYSSVVIHPSESSFPFGRDDWESCRTSSSSVQDLSNLDSDAASILSRDAKPHKVPGRHSIDPSSLSHYRQMSGPSSSSRSLLDSRFNSESTLISRKSTDIKPSHSSQHSYDRYSSSYTSESSGVSRPHSSSDTRSSETTNYGSDSMQVPGHSISPSSETPKVLKGSRHDSSDSVFTRDEQTPLSTDKTKDVKKPPKNENINVMSSDAPALNRKTSMRKAYGIYDEADKVLSKCLRKNDFDKNQLSSSYMSINEANKMQKIIESPETAHPKADKMQKSHSLPRDLSAPVVLDQSREKDLVVPSKEANVNENLNKIVNLKRAASEQFHPIKDAQEKCSDSKNIENSRHNNSHSPSIPLNSKQRPSSLHVHSRSQSQDKLSSDGDIKKRQQQAVINFMEMKTSANKHSSSSGSGDYESISSSPEPKPSTEKRPSLTTQSVLEISQRNKDRVQRYESLRSNRSKSTSKESDYIEMTSPSSLSRKQTEWSRIRTEINGGRPGSIGSDSSLSLTPRNSVCESINSDGHFHRSQNSRDSEDLSSTPSTPRSIKRQSNSPMMSPTYQNLKFFHRPPPPPPVADDEPPALPPRSFRKTTDKSKPADKSHPRSPVMHSKPPTPKTEESPEKKEEALEFNSLRSRWENSPREEAYAESLRKQLRRLSEQQYRPPTKMTLLHTKTQTSLSQSIKHQPPVAQKATSPTSGNSPSSPIGEIKPFSSLSRSDTSEDSMSQSTVKSESNRSTPVPTSFSDASRTSPVPPPTPPRSYGEGKKEHEDELPPPPPELLKSDVEDKHKDGGENDERFADDTYGSYRSKNSGSREIGKYKRSISAVDPRILLENNNNYKDDKDAPVERKLQNQTWKSEVALSHSRNNEMVKSDITPSSDSNGNIPSFQAVESAPSHGFVKATVKSLQVTNRQPISVQSASLWAPRPFVRTHADIQVDAKSFHQSVADSSPQTVLSGSNASITASNSPNPPLNRNSSVKNKVSSIEFNPSPTHTTQTSYRQPVNKFNATNPHNENRLLNENLSKSNNNLYEINSPNLRPSATDQEFKSRSNSFAAISPLHGFDEPTIVTSVTNENRRPSADSILNNPKDLKSSTNVCDNSPVPSQPSNSHDCKPEVVHIRQRSQEELECDKSAAILAKQLESSDKKLSSVLRKDSRSTMHFMDGLFSDSMHLSKKPSQAESSKDKQSPKQDKSKTISSANQNDLDNAKKKDSVETSPLPATYWVSPPKAALELKLRNDMADDLTKELGDGENLVQKKEELMQKLLKKIDILKKERQDLQEEINENEVIGKQVADTVEKKCLNQSEVDKFKSFIEDMEKIVRLLLKLSGLLARAENAVQSLPEDVEDHQKQITVNKRDRLYSQHEEAKDIKADVDRRSNNVIAILKLRLCESELSDYEYYIKMKSKLLIESQELEDKITLGQEQILALRKSLP